MSQEAGRVRVAIVDYGMGNLASVHKALERAGAHPFVSDDPAALAAASFLVLPGVGNFGSGMAQLERRRQDDFVRQWAGSGRPLLGICLGMQMLFESSDEGDARGLGILPGRVVRLNGGLKVPHMGWNSITAPAGSTFSDFDGHSFYFVHSYVCVPERQTSGATTEYGGRFVSAVQWENVAGVQFHPEKSSEDGIELLRRILGALG